MAKSYLDKDGLLYFWQKIKTYFTGTVVPSMDGTGSTGSSVKFAREDHVHPSDTNKVDKVTGKGLSTNDYTTAEKNKLSGIASGAEVNQNAFSNVKVGSTTIAADGKTDTLELVAGNNIVLTPDATNDKATIGTSEVLNTVAAGSSTPGHVWKTIGPDAAGWAAMTAQDVGAVPTTRTVNGKALSSDITISASDVGAVPTTRTVNGKALSSDITISASDVSAIPTSAKGAASGVCPLNASSKIDAAYLPSYVDDIVEAYPVSGATALSAGWLSETSGGSALTPESGKIYILMVDAADYAANTQFRWSGSTYVKLADGGVSAITNAEIDAIVAA